MFELLYQSTYWWSENVDDMRVFCMCMDQGTNLVLIYECVSLGENTKHQLTIINYLN